MAAGVTCVAKHMGAKPMLPGFSVTQYATNANKPALPLPPVGRVGVGGNPHRYKSNAPCARTSSSRAAFLNPSSRLAGNRTARSRRAIAASIVTI